MSLSKLHLPAFLDIKNLYPAPIPPDQVTNPSQWFFPVTQLAFMSSTMLPRSARIKIAAPLLLVLVSRTRSVNTGDIKDFLRMIHVCGLGLKFVDFGMLVPDGAEYKVVKMGNGDGKVEVRKREEGRKGVWGKVGQSVELWFFTNRGVGWNWEVGGIPECPDESRRFVSLLPSSLYLSLNIQIPILKYSPNNRLEHSLSAPPSASSAPS